VIYAGAGCAARPDSAAALAAFARAEGIPVTTTLLALGAFPPDDKRHLGMLGMHGTRAANQAIAECDLLIALGARFDDRATGKLVRFAPHARIVHVDIDEAEIGKLKQPYIGMVADAGKTCGALAAAATGKKRDAWDRRIAALKAMEIGPRNAEEGHPARFLAEVSDLLPAGSIVSTDVGQHQMWAAQAMAVAEPRSFLTSGGLGTMGFGLPTAIGAALAAPDRRVVCVSGDGSLLMNIQEFATLAETKANVTVLIMDNGHLGLVRQQQELFYKENFVASRFDSRPDFALIAAGFGLRAVDLAEADNPRAALVSAFAEEGPTVIRVPVDALANVYPMVPPGAANEDAIGSYADDGAEEESA